jgi:hypothetical protein
MCVSKKKVRQWADCSVLTLLITFLVNVLQLSLQDEYSYTAQFLQRSRTKEGFFLLFLQFCKKYVPHKVLQKYTPLFSTAIL